MHQTRQFTKRRPQSPLPQQNNVDGLQVGVNKPRSGLAIQSSAPIHATRSFKKEQAEHQEHSHYTQQTHVDNHQEHHHDHHSDMFQSNHHTHEHGLLNHHNDAEHHHHDHSHDFHHHDHGHNHSNHGHNPSNHGHLHNHSNHDHSHDHHHHGHDHHHFPQVYTQPLPSYSSIFATLAPPQKALFTFFLGYSIIGMTLFAIGAARESLAVVGFSYLVLFDAFGILNNFVSSVLKYNVAFSSSSTKRPYGLKRFDIVFAFANAIFLLFGTMFTTKESLEHLLVEEGHHDADHGFPFGLILVLLLAIGSSFGSSVKLGNHDNLLNLTRKSSTEYNHMESPIQILAKNMYSLSIVATGSLILFLSLFGLSSGHFDKMIAFCEAGLMLYLGGPTAAALAKVLLQTMPDGTNMDYYLGSLRQHVPGVLSLDKVHFWQNEYGKLVGTLEIQSRPDANEDDIISQSLSILEPLVKEGEITISVTKSN